MRRILPLTVLALLITLSSCSYPDDPNPVFKSEGLITGPDMRLCVYPCCGGWFIEIEGERYRFGELPPNSDISLSMELLPIPVVLTWSKAGNGDGCSDDIITVHTIKRQ